MKLKQFLKWLLTPTESSKVHKSISMEVKATPSSSFDTWRTKKKVDKE